MAKTKAAKEVKEDVKASAKRTCEICGQQAFVRHTDTEQLDDGSVLITRSIVCSGPRRHTYQDHETRGAAKRIDN